MRDLQSASVWAVWAGPRGDYLQPNGNSAVADDPSTLVPFFEASMALSRLTSNGTFPPHHSLALSLDVARCISIGLLNCWSEDTGISEGASAWTEALGSYSYVERCHSSPEGTSIRLLCRGQLPDPAMRGQMPAKVLIQESGFVTLTCQRISPFPVWRTDTSGTIKDASGPLSHLLTDPVKHEQRMRQEREQEDQQFRAALRAQAAQETAPEPETAPVPKKRRY